MSLLFVSLMIVSMSAPFPLSCLRMVSRRFVGFGCWFHRWSHFWSIFFIISRVIYVVFAYCLGLPIAWTRVPGVSCSGFGGCSNVLSVMIPVPSSIVTDGFSVLSVLLMIVPAMDILLAVVPFCRVSVCGVSGVSPFVYFA